jgi:hypothetical protein
MAQNNKRMMLVTGLRHGPHLSLRKTSISADSNIDIVHHKFKLKLSFLLEFGMRIDFVLKSRDSDEWEL